jgi:hypothetical protein
MGAQVVARNFEPSDYFCNAGNLSFLAETSTLRQG